MSEEMQKDPLQEELDASLAKEAELEKENAALGAELSKKKEGMLDRLNAEAKENVDKLNNSTRPRNPSPNARWPSWPTSPRLSGN